MGLINVNTDDLPESDAVPSGEYKLRADEVSEAEFDKNSNKFIKIKWTIIHPEEYTNRKVNENYVPLEGRALLRKITRAAEKEGVIKDTQDIVGWEVRAILRTEKSDEFGEQNRVATYLAPGQQVSAPPRRRK